MQCGSTTLKTADGAREMNNPDTPATPPQREGSTEDKERYKRDITRIFVRPIATPMSLGFLALGAATLVLCGLQLGWYPPQQGTYVAVVLIAFAFPLQLVASIFAFLGRDAVAGTGMGLLASSWLVIGVINYLTPPGATNPVLGLFLVFAGLAVFIPATTAVLGKLVASAVLFLTGLRFVLTGIYHLTGAVGVQYAAGIEGLVLVVVTFYAALALQLEDLQHKTVLPTLRRDRGKASMEGNIEEQIDYIDTEAGVREQL